MQPLEKPVENPLEKTDTKKFTKNCLSCKPADAEEKQRTIYETDQIKVVLRVDNQCWLGRCIVVPKQHISPSACWSNPEMMTLIGQHIARVTAMCKKAFGAALTNVAQLGNLTEDDEGKKTSQEEFHHCHFHVIPRYEKTPKFADKEWPDPQWGKALNIDPKAGLPVVKPTSQEIDLIVASLKRAL